MTLLEKFVKNLNANGLDFRVIKECNDKFKGILIDMKTLVEVPYELHKSLQANLMKLHIEWCRKYIDMAIELNKMKGGK